jgi:hypothetical protein
LVIARVPQGFADKFFVRGVQHDLLLELNPIIAREGRLGMVGKLAGLCKWWS